MADTKPTGISNFERFFRVTASLDVDRDDLKRYREFVTQKLNDLFVRGDAIAKANGRDVVEPFDLPITKGLQESIHEFERIDAETGVRPFLDALADWPQGGMPSDATRARLADIEGGVSVALARTFKIMDTGLKNPQSTHWERAFRVFDLLL